MKNLFSILLLFLVITTSSFAQSSTNISKGTSVKILEIAKSDSYYNERADLLGKDATTLGELTKGKDGFYSGTLETSSGRTIFFTDVKVSVKGSTSSTVPAKTSVTSTSTSTKTPKFVTGTIICYRYY